MRNLETNREQKKKILSHILTVGAPFLVLVVITIAWFIHMTSSQIGQMSFAAEDTGASVRLYYGAVDLPSRQYQASTQPATLTNTVTWGKEVNIENFKISIDNMVPGQCEYYRIDASSPIEVYLSNVHIFDSEGKEVAEGTGVPLAQCIGFYLIPTEQLKPAGTASLTEKTEVTCSLERMDNGQLSAALLRETVPLKAISPVPASKGYVLAVFCDPSYLQGADLQPVGNLPGSIQLSLSFVTQEQAK